MFDRLTVPARTALLAAKSEAQHAGAEAVDVEHLLLAIAAMEARGDLPPLLHDRGITEEAIRASLEPAEPHGAEVPFSSELKRTLQRATLAAESPDATLISPHDLIMAMGEGRTPVGDLLRSAGVVEPPGPAATASPASVPAAVEEAGEQRERRLKRSHKIALWGLAVGVVGIVATISFDVWQLRIALRDYQGPWLRFQYFVCTGPYNNTAAYYERLPHVAARSRATRWEDLKPDFVVRNAVFAMINGLELTAPADYNRASTVTFVELSEPLLDLITGWRDAKAPDRRAEMRRKLTHYYEHFTAHRPTIKQLAALKAVPPWVSFVLNSTPSYDEEIDLAVVDNPHNDALIGYAYFRSTRTVHVRIENVSPFNLTDVSLDLSAKGPFKPAGRLVEERSAEEQRAVFPLEVLKPGEALVYPLSVALVPHLEASGLVRPHEDVLRGAEAGDVLNLEEFEARVYSRPSQTALRLSPSYELREVTFSVENRDERETAFRPRAVANTLYVDANCECGSCPLIMMKGREQGWRRMQEFLRRAKGASRASDFSVPIPEQAAAIRIAEYPGETTTLTSLRVTTREGRVLLDVLPRGGVVTYDTPLDVDLSSIPGSRAGLQLAGRGYYETASKAVCPFVLPLPAEAVR